MDLAKYRSSTEEHLRTENLSGLIPASGRIALDIGARDGHFSRILADRYESVVALDLQKPEFVHPGVECVSGDVTGLEYPDSSFDFVMCTEVLEHIPPAMLEKACSELGRVCKDYLLIGVPYKQDIRVARTTCYTCGKKNPRWGHINTFDERKLCKLFESFNVEKIEFVGTTDEFTNFVSVFLMDLAGNPYGTYVQDELCIYCGSKLKQPPERNLIQKILTRLAFYARNLTRRFKKPLPIWVHILFRKKSPE